MSDTRMTTGDRVKQVDWLIERAAVNPPYVSDAPSAA
jgi:hypothetical protein